MLRRLLSNGPPEWVKMSAMIIAMVAMYCQYLVIDLKGREVLELRKEVEMLERKIDFINDLRGSEPR